LIEPALRGLDLTARRLDVLDARAGAHQLLRRAGLERARLRLLQLLAAHAVLQLVELLLDRVALGHRRAERDFGVVTLRLGCGARLDQRHHARAIEARLLQRDLLRLQARRRRRDLLAPRAGLGLLQRRLGRDRARLGLLDLFRTRALLQLLEVGLRHVELALRGQPLRLEIARLQHQQRLPRPHAIPSAQAPLLDAAAGARADADGARLAGAAPLVRLPPLIDAVAAVADGEGGDDGERQEARVGFFRLGVGHD